MGAYLRISTREVCLCLVKAAFKAHWWQERFQWAGPSCMRLSEGWQRNRQLPLNYVVDE